MLDTELIRFVHENITLKYLSKNVCQSCIVIFLHKLHSQRTQNLFKILALGDSPCLQLYEEHTI